MEDTARNGHGSLAPAAADGQSTTSASTLQAEEALPVNATGDFDAVLMEPAGHVTREAGDTAPEGVPEAKHARSWNIEGLEDGKLARDMGARKDDDGIPVYDMVLRIEWCSGGEIKGAVTIVILTILAGIAITTYQKVKQQRNPVDWYAPDSYDVTFQDNLVTSIVCVVCTGVMWLLYTARGVWYRLRQLRWDHRRHRIYFTKLAELTALLISFAAWATISNARRTVTSCGHFNDIVLVTYVVRQTAANTLLCLWTISVRAMTLWRGGPNTASFAQRTRLWFRKAAIKSYKKSAEVVTHSATGVAASLPHGRHGGAHAAGQQPAEAHVALQVEPEAGEKAAGGKWAVAAGAGQDAAGRNGGDAAALPPAPPPAPLAPAPAPPPVLPAGEKAAGGGAGLGAQPAAGEAAPEDVVLGGLQDGGPVSRAAAAPTPDPLRPGVEPGSGDSGGAAAVAGAGAAAGADPGAPGAAAANAGTDAPAAPTAGEVVAAPETPDPASASGSPPPPAKPAAGTASGKQAERPPLDPSAIAVAAGVAEGDEEVMYIDAPWYEYLAPFLWLWMPFECVVGINTALTASRIHKVVQGRRCIDWFLQCGAEAKGTTAFSLLLLLGEVVYVLIFFGMCLRAFAFLRDRSYVQYRQLNIYLSVEVRVRGVALLFIVANDFVQGLVVPTVTVNGVSEQCTISVEGLLGVWSTQAVFMVLVVTLSWLFVPRSVRGRIPVLQATLQRFAWTEAEMPARLSRRLASVPPASGNEDTLKQLAKEPMFCFETALKCTYWCEHIYYYEEPGCAMRLPVEQLLGLYDLGNLECIREVESDAKVMIASNYQMMLVCFRGTASLKAACVDLKALLVPYYQRKAWHDKATKLAALSAVHHGFQWSWTHKGFADRVLDRVKAYRQQHPHGKILVTGHSLGGAHATLCSLDIARVLGDSLNPKHLSCYTFGCPRVGNRSFASLYDDVVKETWHVINGSDMVPLSPKYVAWFTYKHPGEKVIVRRSGDLIVRPTFTENAVARLPCSRSVRHHLLGSYIRSYMSVLHNQLYCKHIEGGVRALVNLSAHNLPEPNALLGELIHTVELVAVRALEGADELDLKWRDREVAAMTAAERACPKGEMVLDAMARYDSVRLLMLASAPQTHHVGLAPGDNQCNTSETTATSVGGDEQGEDKFNVLRALVKQGNLCMELLGIETGLFQSDSSDLPGALASAGGSTRDATPVDAKAGRHAELVAFDRALKEAAAARVRKAEEKAAAKRRKYDEWVKAARGGVLGWLVCASEADQPAPPDGLAEAAGGPAAGAAADAAGEAGGLAAPASGVEPAALQVDVGAGPAAAPEAGGLADRLLRIVSGRSYHQGPGAWVPAEHLDTNRRKVRAARSMDKSKHMAHSTSTSSLRSGPPATPKSPRVRPTSDSGAPSAQGAAEAQESPVRKAGPAPWDPVAGAQGPGSARQPATRGHSSGSGAGQEGGTSSSTAAPEQQQVQVDVRAGPQAVAESRVLWLGDGDGQDGDDLLGDWVSEGGGGLGCCLQLGAAGSGAAGLGAPGGGQRAPRGVQVQVEAALAAVAVASGSLREAAAVMQQERLQAARGGAGGAAVSAAAVHEGAAGGSGRAAGGGDVESGRA